MAELSRRALLLAAVGIGVGAFPARAHHRPQHSRGKQQDTTTTGGYPALYGGT